MECIFSDYYDTRCDAKQSVAWKAIVCLMHMYKFEVNDAIYKSGSYAVVLYSLERESFTTARERVLAIIDELQPSALVVEQDCFTSRCKEY